MGYLYILKCNDGSFYTGSTINLDKRINQHKDGKAAQYTKSRLPVILVYFEEFQSIKEAFYREKQIQKWSKKKKEALISGEYNRLHKLSRCTNASSHKNIKIK